MMARDASRSNMFVIMSNTAQMDQMKNLKCVQYGSVQQEGGNVQITSCVSVAARFVMRIVIVKVDQMKQMRHVPNVQRVSGNVAQGNVLQPIKCVMILITGLTVMIKQMRILQCARIGTALIIFGNVIMVYSVYTCSLFVIGITGITPHAQMIAMRDPIVRTGIAQRACGNVKPEANVFTLNMYAILCITLHHMAVRINQMRIQFSVPNGSAHPGTGNAGIIPHALIKIGLWMEIMHVQMAQMKIQISMLGELVLQAICSVLMVKNV